MDVDRQPKNFGQQYMLNKRVHTFKSECAAHNLDVGFLNIEFLRGERIRRLIDDKDKMEKVTSKTIKTIQKCGIRIILLQRKTTSRKGTPDVCRNDIKATVF